MTRSPSHSIGEDAMKMCIFSHLKFLISTTQDSIRVQSFNTRTLFPWSDLVYTIVLYYSLCKPRHDNFPPMISTKSDTYRAVLPQKEWPETWNFEFEIRLDITNKGANQLISVCVFAYAKCRFFYDVARIIFNISPANLSCWVGAMKICRFFSFKINYLNDKR